MQRSAWRRYRFHVANKPIEAKSIINVAAHPTILSIHGILNCLMTFLLVEKSMVTIVTGTATTPLMMAAQKSAPELDRS